MTTVAPAAEAATTATAEPRPSPSAGPLGREAAGRYLADLFAEHGRMVLGLCRLLLRDSAEAEDAAQQVFLSAHQAVLRGSLPRDPPAWIAAIARNECRARVRARMREPLALPELPSDLPDPLAAAIRAVDLEAVWAALGALPRRQRKALLLRELGGLSYHELGRALGVSHSAVESLLFRARQHVRSVLASAAPFAFRDQLAQLIPGFDPGSAGVVARFATLPVAWKLAGAAVTVGVVATGASGLHSRTPVVARAPQHARAHVTPAPPRQRARPRPPVVVTADVTVTHQEPRHRRERRREREHVERRGEGPRPAPAPAPVRTETNHEGPGDGAQTTAGATTTTTDGSHSGSDNSGPDGGSSGSDGGGSGHSGPG